MAWNGSDLRGVRRLPRAGPHTVIFGGGSFPPVGCCSLQFVIAVVVNVGVVDDLGAMEVVSALAAAVFFVPVGVAGLVLDVVSFAILDFVVVVIVVAQQRYNGFLRCCRVLQQHGWRRLCLAVGFG